MQVCVRHWTELRAEVDGSGLGVLVAEGGDEATRRLRAQALHGVTIDNFEPLLLAHNSILANCARLAARERVLHELAADDEACPICFMSALHDRTCEGPPCVFPKDGTAFDYMIARAVADQVEVWKGLQP